MRVEKLSQVCLFVRARLRFERENESKRNLYKAKTLLFPLYIPFK